MNRFKLAGICVITSTLALSGCVARTYNLTRDRVDQDLTSSTGNRGYLMGVPPEAKARSGKSTRTTRVFEVELGLAKKSDVKCPSTAPLTTFISEPTMMQEARIENVNTTFEQYTVTKNDTLQKISQKFYGTTKNWTKIYEANKNILSTPNKLYPGQTLNIPSDSDLGTVSKNLIETERNLK
ncbi:MAG: LysM peptidoglycan-binding domain-containing protein [Candidatus Omnitrophica bacterium]|nr:LysM peptidoglycan-binding domain-containing protein [Candidatus Omnitrophota bacterium]